MPKDCVVLLYFCVCLLYRPNEYMAKDCVVLLLLLLLSCVCLPPQCLHAQGLCGASSFYVCLPIGVVLFTLMMFVVGRWFFQPRVLHLRWLLFHCALVGFALWFHVAVGTTPLGPGGQQPYNGAFGVAVAGPSS